MKRYQITVHKQAEERYWNLKRRLDRFLDSYDFQVSYRARIKQYKRSIGEIIEIRTEGKLREEIYERLEEIAPYYAVAELNQLVSHYSEEANI